MESTKRSDFSIASLMRDSPPKRRRLDSGAYGFTGVYQATGWMQSSDFVVVPTTVQDPPCPAQSPDSQAPSEGVRTPSPPSSSETSPATTDRTELTSSPSPSNGSDQSMTSEEGDSARKRKKARTAFTADQLSQLEARFRAQRYLAANERTYLARHLGLKDQQVKTWFQNRRMKDKRQAKELESRLGPCMTSLPLSIQTQPLASQPSTYNLAATTLLTPRDQLLGTSFALPPSTFADSRTVESPLYLDTTATSRPYTLAGSSSFLSYSSAFQPTAAFQTHLMY